MSLIVKCRLTDHLEKSGFIAPGFRSGHSTYDQIYRLRKDIHTSLNSRKVLPVLFLDIVKAFDRVPHDRLLFKLHRFAGISGKAWGWIRAFLTDRKFFVTSNGTKSDPVFARAGVPQGTVLAPLFFLIYINDLIPPALLSSACVNAAMFADDVCVWPSLSVTRLKSQYNCLRKFLKHCTEWSEVWGLEFSVDKTQIVLFNRKRNSIVKPLHPLCLTGRAVSFASSYKYLGVLMDENGSFSTHCTQLITKAKLTAFQIARIFRRNKAPTPTIALNLIKAILIPQICYGFHFIITPTKKLISSLTQVMALALRRSLCLSTSTAAQRVIWEFGLPDVGSIHTHCVLQTYNRSLLISRSHPHSLPAMYANDVSLHVPDPAQKFHKSLSSLCRAILTRIPPQFTFPLKSKTLTSLTALHATEHWVDTTWQQYRIIKPHYAMCDYLSVDWMPAAVIRARLRMGALCTHVRLWQSKTTDSPLCPQCRVEGDATHMLLLCPVFRLLRDKCQEQLNALYYPVELSVQLLFGEPPPPPNDRTLYDEKTFLRIIHLKCLAITAEYLCAVSSKHFL